MLAGVGCISPLLLPDIDCSTGCQFLLRLFLTQSQAALQSQAHQNQVSVTLYGTVCWCLSTITQRFPNSMTELTYVARAKSSLRSFKVT